MGCTIGMVGNPAHVRLHQQSAGWHLGFSQKENWSTSQLSDHESQVCGMRAFAATSQVPAGQGDSAGGRGGETNERLMLASYLRLRGKPQGACPVRRPGATTLLVGIHLSLGFWLPERKQHRHLTRCREGGMSCEVKVTISFACPCGPFLFLFPYCRGLGCGQGLGLPSLPDCGLSRSLFPFV